MLSHSLFHVILAKLCKIVFYSDSLPKWKGKFQKGKLQNKSLYDPDTRKCRIMFFFPIPSTLTVKLHFLVGKDFILNLFHAM